MGTNTTGGTSDRASNVKRVEVAVDENASNEEIELLKKIHGYGDATFTGVELNVTPVNQRDGKADEEYEYVQTGNKTELNVKAHSQAVAEGLTLAATDTPKGKDQSKKAALAKKAAADKKAEAKGDRGDN